MSTTPISGKDGKVVYGTTTVGVTKWTYKPKAGEIDVSNTTDGRRRIGGLQDAEGTFEAHIDTSATTETDLAVGTIIVLKLYTDGTKSFLNNYCMITDIDYSNQVDGAYDGTFSWKLAQGTPVSAPA